MTKEPSTGANRASAVQPYWILYVAGLLGGAILLADALGFAPLQRVTAKLAVALIYSTFALMIGKGKLVSISAAALIWATIVATFIW